MKKRILLYALLLTLLSCNSTPDNPADTIYLGGNIITMKGDSAQYAEAIAVKDGKILFVGSEAEAKKYRGDSTIINNLEGKTMLPGFIDPHSHFINATQLVNWVNVSPRPVGQVNSVEELKNTIAEFIKNKPLKENEWLVGYGYDQTMFEDREATCYDLDEVVPDNPLLIIHVSSHGALLNSKALEISNITAETKDPAGGVISRMPNSKKPSGLLMENAFLPVHQNMPKPTIDDLLKSFDKAQEEYTKWGYTTAQEGASSFDDLQLLKKASDDDLLVIDIISYPLFIDMDKIIGKENFGQYKKHLKVGGIKVLLDGSPQGGTAMQDYLTPGPNGEAHWQGVSFVPKDVFFKVMQTCYDNNLQLNVHTNGSGAIQEMIDGMDEINYDKSKDLRWCSVHCQFVTNEQLDKIAELGMVPSFFTNHAFYWGDVHIKNFGFEVANKLSPIESAYKKGLRPTNHTDYSVTPLDPFMTIWTAVKRETRSGQIIGPEERATIYQALQMLTSNVAYQYHEEDTKGTLEVGKLADLVILDKNPLDIDESTIDDIKNTKVVETIKEGMTVYEN
ncbi:amidohydrolase [Mangrovibacterium lignilyticum]|uniref:amidohydrolase n=1 Tax=Mangrovibacterium lignilyticum TaxID=2668052 RepID=UPI0013D6AF3F|nr:amidohydrolase [Mangrovibacterium lignilyticum]